jgi:succinate dehydrogenase/fumarate reductase flavoprotein subunit
MQHATNAAALAALVRDCDVMFAFVELYMCVCNIQMKVPTEALAKTFADYNQIAASKKDPYGKQFFDSVPFDMNEEYYVALVTPVVHYTMGGLNCAADAAVRTPRNEAIAGLFCTGEVMGGVHGVNRLGGSSLLDCVVFGRVAGAR